MNTRPPPQGAPPPNSFVTRMYRRNLRPVVITIASISAIWALFSAVGNFRSVGVARDQNFSRLATFGIILGSLSAATCAFEAFGLFAAITQRLPLARIYAWLSTVTAAAMIGGSLIRVILHFTMRNDIIGECTAVSQGNSVIYPYGWFGPRYHDFIDADDADRFCRREWDRDSWSDIIALLIVIVLAVLFTMIAFAYYRQLLDPASVANMSRAPQAHPGGFPSHYNPPYNASVPHLGYNMPYSGGPPPQGYPAYPAYAPPPGPPPSSVEADSKPPGYIGRDGEPGYGAEKENPFADFDDGPSHRDERK